MDENMQNAFRAEPHDCVHLLIKTAKLHHSVVENRVTALGIHHSQHRMLMYLAKDEKTLSQKDIANDFGVSAAAVASMLKRLEKEGYITRSMTDGDNRRNEIRITDKGRQTVKESRDIFDGIDRDMFSGFDESEINTLCGMLDRLSQNLDGEPDGIADTEGVS